MGKMLKVSIAVFVVLALLAITIVVNGKLAVYQLF
jgi:hypothetical protein